MTSSDRMIKFIGGVIILILVLGIIDYATKNKKENNVQEELIKNEITINNEVK